MSPLKFLCRSPKAQDLRMWEKAKLVSGQPSAKEMRHMSHGSNLPLQQKPGKTCGGPSCLMIWTLIEIRTLCQQKHCEPGLKGTETRWNEGWMTPKVVQGFIPPWPKRAAWEGRATLLLLMSPEDTAFSQRLFSGLKLEWNLSCYFQTWLRTVTPFFLTISFLERGYMFYACSTTVFWK